MSEISRKRSKEYVEVALDTLADLSSYNIENASFEIFTEYDKAEFLRNLSKVIVNSGYDISLNQSLPEEWHTMDDCIDYVEHHILEKAEV